MRNKVSALETLIERLLKTKYESYKAGLRNGFLYYLLIAMAIVKKYCMTRNYGINVGVLLNPGTSPQALGPACWCIWRTLVAFVSAVSSHAGMLAQSYFMRPVLMCAAGSKA